MSRIPIAILDHSPAFLDLLVYVLKRQESGEVDVVAASADINELLAQASTDPKVILFGLSVPHLVDPQKIKRLRDRWPDSRIIVLSWIDMEEYREQALSAEADAVIPKTKLDVTLLPAIRQLSNGKV